ncbi:hypothetical protein GQ457_06G016700 [Hibiscus cannabinus]
MNPWQIKWVCLLSLTLLLVGSEGKDDVWDFLVSKTTVVIKNNVQPETALTVHCKSEDDDLKAHVLPYNGYFKFDFIPSAFKRTLFYCRMEWNGKSHWFDVYDGERDSGAFFDNFVAWSIMASGPCTSYKLDSPGLNSACYPWKTHP